MIDITVWTKHFLLTLNETFENRVWFVGLQGSYGRGEAIETILSENPSLFTGDDAPLEYADLILNGEPELYLKAVTQYKPMDS